MTLKSLSAAVAVVSTLALGPATAVEVARMPVDAGAVKNLMTRDPVQFQRLSSIPRAMKGKGCTFYEHENGRGEAWHKAVGWLADRSSSQDSYAEYVTTVGPWWNDRISSMSCDESANVHCSVGVYRDNNKGGGEAIFWGSQGLFNLSDFGWNDTISSYAIFCNLMK